ncbi:MAG: HAD-IA family hydrolase [Hyphomicrobiales bacterium]|nr:HAD-IA family hydrolase [Hyphomicrobiales bacterium]
MTPPTIKAVLWDFGGVFTTGPFVNFARYEREHGLPENFLRRVNSTNPDTNAWARFERDEIDLAEFDRAFAAESRALGHAVPGAEVIKLIKGDLRPEMVAALRRVKQHFACACITNNVREPDPDASDASLYTGKAGEVAAVLALFDLVIESSKVGLRKPDPRIYQMALDALNVAPTEAVYLDDLGVNLKPAREMGMTTIKVGEAEAAISELEGVLGILLSSE